MAKTILFYDTETTGLPRSYSAPISDGSNWPRLVQIAYIIYDGEGNRIKSNSAIIKPQGFEIPYAASSIHGITTERAEAEGVLLSPVLKSIHNRREESDIVVGHNIEFDENILAAEFYRESLPITKKPVICSMRAATQHCKIPSARGGYKWPRLNELHKTLFGVGFEAAHNAAADIEATAKCFWELVRIGVVKI